MLKIEEAESGTFFYQFSVNNSWNFSLFQLSDSLLLLRKKQVEWWKDSGNSYVQISVLRMICHYLYY